MPADIADQLTAFRIAQLMPVSNRATCAGIWFHCYYFLQTYAKSRLECENDGWSRDFDDCV